MSCQWLQRPTLAGDLAFRVVLSDSIQPDVFLSLHHNSVASLDRSINETQTYYPLGDSGASLDLARSIHRHLVLNLEITPAKILPGNFHVLRNATVPAVLGEPAMISNPVIEGRLSLAASQRLEAEAYFLGLLDYFGQGNPVWSGAPLDTLPVPVPGQASTMIWSFLPDRMGPEAGNGPGLDPATVRVTRDGELQPFTLDPEFRTIQWTSTGSGDSSASVLEVTARNLAGRGTPRRRTVVPATRSGLVTVTAYTDAHQQDPVVVGWRTFDGRPAPAGRIILGPDLILDIAGGARGWSPVPVGSWPADDPAPTFEPAADGVISPTVTFDSRVLPDPWRWVLLTDPTGSAVAMPSGGVVRLGSGQTSFPASCFPELGSPLVTWAAQDPLWVEIPGYLPLVRKPLGQGVQYETFDSSAPVWPLTPLFPDLLGKVVVLDPDGGGSDPDGTGPLGLRGADLNLEVTLILADLLRGGGADVHLTRRAGTVPRPEEKVALAGAVGADLFLTIGRTRHPGGPTAAHHHGSVVGIRWAELFQLAAAPLVSPGDSVTVTPAWDYLLRHTACPAIEVRMPGPDGSAAEMRMTDRAWQRSEALVLFQTLAAVTAGVDSLLPVLDPAEFLASAGEGVDLDTADLAVLDGQFVWTPKHGSRLDLPPEEHSEEESDALSSWEGPGLPILPGIHTLEIHAAGRWVLYRYELQKTVGFFELMMSGP